MRQVRPVHEEVGRDHTEEEDEPGCDGRAAMGRPYERDERKRKELQPGQPDEHAPRRDAREQHVPRRGKEPGHLGDQRDQRHDPRRRTQAPLGDEARQLRHADGSPEQQLGGKMPVPRVASDGGQGVGRTGHGALVKRDKGPQGARVPARHPTETRGPRPPRTGPRALPSTSA